jgi:poly(hydroxyalkanoate) depolymerase family esterase
LCAFDRRSSRIGVQGFRYGRSGRPHFHPDPSRRPSDAAPPRRPCVAKVSRFNDLAEAKGIYALYPNQERGRNPFNCWNWFLSDNEKPDRGEPKMIMAQLELARAKYPIDPKRIYVVGWSAGGGTVPTLLSCFPDVFAAGAIHSGLPYGVATSIGGALDLMRNGPAPNEPREQTACNPTAFHGGVMVVQGTADQIVNPTNATRILSDFLPPDAIRGAPEIVAPANGKLGYEVIDWSVRGKLAARELLVEQMDHAWSGGLPDMPYSDPKGPSATDMMWSFFTNFSRP